MDANSCWCTDTEYAIVELELAAVEWAIEPAPSYHLGWSARRAAGCYVLMIFAICMSRCRDYPGSRDCREKLRGGHSGSRLSA